MKLILHHAGWIPRIDTTIELANMYPNVRILFGLACEESNILQGLFGDRVQICGNATDTFTEAVAVYKVVTQQGIDTIHIVTEPGHLERAVLIARIIYWRKNVLVIGVPTKDGGYRSPNRRLLLDGIRALVFRFTGVILMI